MGKKSAPPPAPDYTAAAEKTAASSQDAQTRADWSNRPTQNTPWGQSSWSASAGVDPATGKPITQWEQNISLTPDQQKALDDQMRMQSGRSDLAQNMMGRVGDATSKEFNWGGMQGYGQLGQAGQGMMSGLGDSGSMQARTRIEDAMWDRMKPQHEQQQAGLEGQLANSGLTRGSEAWNREMQRMGDQQSRERFNVMDRGLAEQQGQFGMGLQAGNFQNQAQAQNWGQQMQGADYQNKLRQQQISEQMLQRNMPLNEMNALLTGQQVGMPSMPGFNSSQSAGGANYNMAAQNQYSGAMDQYNASQAQQQGMMSGLGSIAGMGMMAL